MKIHGYAAFYKQAPLQLFSYDLPELGPFEVLIKITHSGLCYTDLYMIDNAWHRSSYPLLPGHEIVGIIIQKGSLASLQLNDRVGVSWVYSSCLNCPECFKGETNICQNKTSIYNKGRFGGFADHVIADSRFTFLLPNTLDSAHAAPLLCAGATIYAPLVRHQIQPGQSVGVIGIGGLGHLALQFYRAFGCTVSAISSTPSKEEEAKNFGADKFYTFKNPPKTSQFDFLLCTSDAQLDWNFILNWLRPNGILCLVSRPLQRLNIDPSLLVSTQRTICGSNNASRSVMLEMLKMAAHHRIKPQIEQMPLSQINTALEKIRRNQVRYRIVLTP